MLAAGATGGSLLEPLTHLDSAAVTRTRRPGRIACEQPPGMLPPGMLPRVQVMSRMVAAAAYSPRVGDAAAIRTAAS